MHLASDFPGHQQFEEMGQIVDIATLFEAAPRPHSCVFPWLGVLAAVEVFICELTVARLRSEQVIVDKVTGKQVAVARRKSCRLGRRVCRSSPS